MIMKIFLILVGGAMLFGGGICVATNAILAISGLFSQGVLVLMGISALVAWGGWGLIRLSDSFKSGKKTDSESARDTESN